MFFNVKAALAEIAAAGEYQAPGQASPRLAELAGLAGLAGRQAETEKLQPPLAMPSPPSRDPEASVKPEVYAYGLTSGGRPQTWTGRIVPLKDWRNLSEWEKHGPNGRNWNGITQTWEQPK
jgi:hypothetical protein